MTDARKVCRLCRQPVKLQLTVNILKAFKERNLDSHEWPEGQPVVFRCPTHGLLAFHNVTHVKPDPIGEQPCLLPLT